MRASTARLTNSPVRLADLEFPQTSRLVHRTRLAFIHLDNLLAFAKRDRDGRVDGYLVAYLPDECLVVFLKKGEAVNAASMHSTGRHVITIGEALKRINPGGRLVVNAIRKEEADKEVLLKLDYASQLWMEKEIKSVANVTRQDVREFLQLAAEANIKPEYQEYDLADANQALLEMKQGKIRGAKVLRIQ